MSTPEPIVVTMFDKPSGNVRGIVNAFMQVKGKEKRICHATLLVGEQPTLTVEVPKNLDLAGLNEFARIIAVFTAKVSELDRK